MNAKDALDLLRDNVNELTESHQKNLSLVKRLNIAQSRAARMFAMSSGQWLVKRATVTPVASVITLPADCSKPIYLEEVTSKIPIRWLSSVGYRALSRSNVDSSYDQKEVYPLARTLEVNADSYTTVCYLWYQQRVPDLITGLAGTGSGASALVLANDLNVHFLDDYYNGVTVEVIDQTSGIVDISSEITDFTASNRTAVITGTPASGDTYGTISLLPQEAMDFIIAEATKMAIIKPSTTIDKEVIAYVRDEAHRARTELEDWIATRVPEMNGVNFGDVY